MKIRIILCTVAAALLFLPVSCSDDSVTEPENGQPDDTYGGLVISYETDDASAESGEITPGAGGSIEATGSNGVTYTLSVSPGAVESAETVTITPLLDLTIGIKDSSAVDTSECLTGALFAPTGLEFDSTAVLTITYPQSGLDCSLTEEFCIVRIDSAETFYEIIPTDVNQGTPSLTCMLTHFSGFGSHAPDYDFLKYLIEETSKAGRLFPGDDVLAKLLGYARQAAAMGWNDLRDLAWQGCRPILDTLVDEAIDDAGKDPGESMFGVLLHYLDPAIMMGFTDIESRIRSAIDALIRSVAQQGHTGCGQGRHEEGRALLYWALTQAQGGYVEDPAFQTQVQSWINSCGAAEVSIAPDKSAVYDVAISTEDASAVVFFEVTVTNFGGDPLDGLNVSILKYNPSTETWSGVSNTNPLGDGKYKGYFVYGLAPYKWEDGTALFKAAAYVDGDPVYSDEVGISLVRRKIKMDYSYTMEYDFNNVLNDIHASGSITGTGIHGVVYDVYECSKMSRSYTYSNQTTSCYYSAELIDNPQVHACFFVIDTDQMPASIGGFSLSLQVLKRVNVIYSDPLYPATIRSQENCQGSTPVDTLLYDRTLFEGGMFSGLWPDDAPMFQYYTPGDGFESYNFVGSTEYDEGHSTLSVILSVAD